jgi:TetR/AcrR family transcriptional repressor of nem operon
MDVRNAILDSAEARIRAGGFHACSFREIASDVGIKSASVHYHFATKSELGAELVARYQKRLLAMLGPPDDDRELAAKIDSMRTIFLTALKRGEGMCLCGILATEARGLPPAVAGAARGYFVACNEWLARAFGQAGVAEPKRRAIEVTALFQGAMLQAVSLDDVNAFEKAVKELRQSF